MATQIKPNQIRSRIEALVKEQQQKAYKSGWVWHQMNNLVESKWQNVSCYVEGCKNLIPDAAKFVAEGGDIDRAMEYLEEMYEQDAQYAAEALAELAN